MLRGIPAILSPNLIKIMMEMGHGNEIVLVDGIFPAAAKAARLVRCDGLDIVTLLTAILTLLPLDRADGSLASVTAVAPCEPQPAIWRVYRDLIHHCVGPASEVHFISHHDFYGRASHAFAVVATSDLSRKGTIMLGKRVIRESGDLIVPNFT